MENKYIKPSTKANIIVASVLAGVALIGLIMLLLLMSKPAKESAQTACIFSVLLMFFITFWVATIQIRVFKEYQSQRKYLCAEGVFIICLTLLVIFTGILFMSLQADKVFSGTLDKFDLRWFLGVFFLGYFIWKIAVLKIAIKEKHFNLWLEIVNAVLWLAFAVVTFVSISATGEAIISYLWAYSAISWLLIINYIAYILISYVFNSPDYLDSPEAQELFKKEVAEKNNRLARVNAMLGIPPEDTKSEQTPTSDLESRLKKLESLKKSGVITKEEYDAKRKKIIDESI